MTIKGGSHTAETRRQISATRRAASGRSTAPLVPQLCACGCGQYAAVDEHRNRVSKYVPGHNARTAHPMQGKHHTEETKARLASYTGEKASAYKHGWAATPTYNSWSSMISRCYDPTNASYPIYGGRGITVCARWLESFENFLADMGERPEGMTLERKNGNRNYEAANCKWATLAEQNANRRNPWETRRAKYGPTGRPPREGG